MKRIYKLILLFSTALIFLVSCSSTKNLNKTYRNDNSINSFEMDTDLFISFDGEESNVKANIKVAKLDSTLITVYGPLSIPVARLYSDHYSFTAHNLFENLAFMGAPVEANMARSFRLPISYSDLIYLIRAQAPFAKEEFSLITEKSNNDSEMYTRKSNYIEYIIIDPNTQLIQQYQKKSLQGELIYNVHFKKYTSVDGFARPGIIQMEFDRNDAVFTLEINKMKKIESFEKEFKFSLPKGCRKIEL